MPSVPLKPNQKLKPVLSSPTFKYGSNTYVVLAFAKMKKNKFSISDIRKLTGRYKTDYEVKRSLEVLERNKSVRKVNQHEWQITATGVQQIIDFSRRKDSPNNLSDY
jgi:hypothetical protein